MATKAYVIPVDTDVLCGRGLTPFRHPGNQWLRERIALNSEKYMGSCSRKAKTVLIHEVILSVMKEGGRFLQLDKTTGKYFDGGVDAAKNRVGAAFRDASVPGKVKCIKKLKASIQRKTSLSQPENSEHCSSSSTALVSERRGPLLDTPTPSPVETTARPMPLRRQVASCPLSLLSVFTKTLDLEPHPIDSDSDDEIDFSSAGSLLEALDCEEYASPYYPTTIFVPSSKS